MNLKASLYQRSTSRPARLRPKTPHRNGSRTLLPTPTTPPISTPQTILLGQEVRLGELESVNQVSQPRLHRQIIGPSILQVIRVVAMAQMAREMGKVEISPATLYWCRTCREAFTKASYREHISRRHCTSHKRRDIAMHANKTLRS